MTIEELRGLSIPELEQYLDALLDLPQPANDEARANFRQALDVLRDRYDEELAAAMGLSLEEYRAFSDAIVPSDIHAQIMAMTPRELHEFLEQFLREMQATLDRRNRNRDTEGNDG
jgi:hypothetical protein